MTRVLSAGFNGCTAFHNSRSSLKDSSMMPSDTKAKLTLSNGAKDIDLPIFKGTIGPQVIDIRKLYGQTGMFTYDPGFLSTASCNFWHLVSATCISIGKVRA